MIQLRIRKCWEFEKSSQFIIFCDNWMICFMDHLTIIGWIKKLLLIGLSVITFPVRQMHICFSIDSLTRKETEVLYFLLVICYLTSSQKHTWFLCCLCKRGSSSLGFTTASFKRTLALLFTFANCCSFLFQLPVLLSWI